MPRSGFLARWHLSCVGRASACGPLPVPLGVFVETFEASCSENVMRADLACTFEESSLVLLTLDPEGHSNVDNGRDNEV